MDSFFLWLEAWPLGIWMREEPSLWAFPFVLILHTVGLAFMVGANVAVDVRALGGATGVPLISMHRYYRSMWAGFWVNAFSGILLLIAYPTKALTNPLFYLKLSLITLALVVGQRIRQHMMSGTVAAGVTAPRPLKVLAAVSVALWLISITAGRFLAYTCSRLMVDQSCR